MASLTLALIIMQYFLISEGISVTSSFFCPASLTILNKMSSSKYRHARNRSHLFSLVFFCEVVLKGGRGGNLFRDVTAGCTSQRKNKDSSVVCDMPRRVRKLFVGF